MVSVAPRTSLPSAWVLRLAALAAVVRLAYLTEHAGTVWLTFPVLDEQYYLTVAEALRAGDRATVALVNPGFRPLFYPAVLAAVRSLTGPTTFFAAVAALQHLLGLFTILLAADLASRISGRVVAGIATGLLLAFAGPMTYFEGELLITSLFTFLVTLALWIPIRFPGMSGLLAAAATLAVATQARPNALLLLPALGVPLWSLSTWRDRFRATGAVVLVVGGILSLSALLQRPWWGEDVFLPSSGGVNLYLGNERGADGRQPRQDEVTTWGDVHRDSVQLFAQTVARRESGHPNAGPGEIDLYWRRRAVAEIRADPLRWSRLLGNKALSLLSNREVPNNRTWDFVREESRVLRLLPVSWGVLLGLFPMGLLGARRGIREGRASAVDLLWIVFALGLSTAGILAFFVAARYRLPLWPAVAVLAGMGLVEAGDRLARRRRRDLFVLTLPLLFGGFAFALDATTPAEATDRDLFYRSLAHLERGATEEARLDIQAALEANPTSTVGWLQLGTVEMADERWQAALAALRRAHELHGDEPRILTNLGVTLEHLGQVGAAYGAYRRAIALDIPFRAALVNASLLELRAGLLDLASGHLDLASRLGPDDVLSLVARSRLAFLRGRAEEAARLMDRARSLDEARCAALSSDLERRLEPSTLMPSPPNVS